MNNNQTTTLAAAGVACTTLAAATLVSALAPGSGDVSAILGAGGTMIVAVVTLGRTGQIKGTIDDLANGKMDAKIRAGVADVLADHLVDEGAKPQLARDRAVRDAQHEAHS